jgi:hypothetical protein
MTRGNDVAQSQSPTEPKWGRPARVWRIFENRFIHVSREVGGVGWWCPKLVKAGLKLAVEILLTSYKYPLYPHRRRVRRKWGLAPYSAPNFILCRVERGRVLRTRGLSILLAVPKVARVWKLCRNPFGFDGVFWALVRSSAGALPEFCEFRQREDSRVPLLYRDPGLSGYPWHYLGVGDLPIIVSHLFASLMLFVHLYTV